MEWDDERAVIVLSLGAPRQRLLGWFLRDSGIVVELADTVEQAVEFACTKRCPVLVINTTVEPDTITGVVQAVRRAAPPLRVIVLHDGRHAAGDAEIPADLCIHDAGDPDWLVETIRAAAGDEFPAGDPHEAAEELA